ncbi:MULTISPECIES: efflux RND transporter periplasmic adaptor subunit [Sphingomonadales]|jgi:cobalt-zinc-cadmium efflux system membrane fusion protein|uniref:Cobalt-zinc-cadmium efflux system membrane fusion protein n=3 Tax=Sphingomonadaceae TaxID=41297 RepID=A0A7W7A973_9SPHN|nr:MULTISPECIES: efflux RND transporter periplasmic adaptor subunit [Sphingomonadales]MBA4165353.1 HlyD family secretion protein [Erythrobacter sp.]MBB4612758.1 cobalt-zinc-cadmium efflux system membrane fusion protein [Novosphingobium taihuense]MDE8653351.1 efflux RND transporter periplasmic adaptor subunit [Novosphingobium album (ex Liu et al. 2023)]MDO7834332.1 efflux RND transporter periplasmic adaptor subunit [Sphingobium sp. HBC34]TWH87893.1 cobalt-zinc-cadmium efflux system membrane fus
MKNIRFTAAIAALALALPLAACGSGPAPAEHGEEGAEAEQGPNGGRLLKDGDFAVEVTVFETGQEPQFRVYASRGGQPVDPGSVQLTMTLRRLGGEVNTFAFKPEGKFLAGQGVVEEPHSFDVEVVAVENGKRHVWKYASPEGRTHITAEAAKAGGIEILTAGPALIGETRELFGTVALDPSARSEIRGQFPGRVVSVTKAVGDYVQRGQLLARIESSESLQVYPVYATVSGVVAERNGNPGNVTGDRALYVITDPAQTSVVFNIFPKDLAVIQPGMRVEIEAMDGTPVAASQLGGYLPEGNAEAGTALVRTSVPNRGGRLRAGMALRGKVVVNAVTVPLAVRTEAIQPFRDFKVVFANFGQDYEVRMLELGRSSPEWTEVLSGIKPGTPYAAKGSFLIRADIEKSGASHDH